MSWTQSAESWFPYSFNCLSSLTCGICRRHSGDFQSKEGAGTKWRLLTSFSRCWNYLIYWLFRTTGHPHYFCKVRLFLDMVFLCVTSDWNCFEAMNTEHFWIMSPSVFLVYAQFNNNFTRLSKFWKQFWKSIKGNKSSQRKEARVVAAYPPSQYIHRHQVIKIPQLITQNTPDVATPVHCGKTQGIKFLAIRVLTSWLW